MCSVQWMPTIRLLVTSYTALRQATFDITHLCVSEWHRGRGIAKQLLNALKERRTSQEYIRLNCRRDFPAHKMWPSLGFSPVAEKVGRSAEGHLLTIWRYNFAKEAQQLGLFQAKISDDAVDAVIDAQIFFDFNELDNDKTMPSKALLEDFLVGSLNICIDDELLVEIDRKEDAKSRQMSKQRSEDYRQVNYDKQKSEEFEILLKDILPKSHCVGRVRHSASIQNCCFRGRHIHHTRQCAAKEIQGNP